MPYLIAIALLLAASVAAAAFRWEIVVGRDGREPTANGIYRLDRWTGEVAWCTRRDYAPPGKLHCAADSDWKEGK